MQESPIVISVGGSLIVPNGGINTDFLIKFNKEDLDWLGIHATHLNGHLLRTIFQDISNPRVIQHYDRKLENWTEPIAIGAGWKPGWTTDYDAVQLAKDFGGKLIINMSNIDYVYDRDPIKFTDAKPLKNITWEEMIKIVGNKHSSGINVPFDPIATKLAKDLKLTVVIANGNDLINIQKIINK